MPTISDALNILDTKIGVVKLLCWVLFTLLEKSNLENERVLRGVEFFYRKIL
jgi:hypothetical protein